MFVKTAIDLSDNVVIANGSKVCNLLPFTSMNLRRHPVPDGKVYLPRLVKKIFLIDEKRGARLLSSTDYTSIYLKCPGLLSNGDITFDNIFDKPRPRQSVNEIPSLWTVCKQNNVKGQNLYNTDDDDDNDDENHMKREIIPRYYHLKERERKRESRGHR